MTINIQKLEKVIQDKLALSPTSEELLCAVKTIKNLKSLIVGSTFSLSNLPSAKFHRGKVWFIESENQLYTSDGIAWRPQHYVARDTLWTWGNNSSGQLGDNSSTIKSSPGTTSGGGTNWSMVSAGGYVTSAIKTDGTLWTWGRNYYGRLGDNSTSYRSSPGTTSGGGTNWSMIGGGRDHTAAIKTDGTLWTWGRNNYGQLGDNSSTDRSSPITTAGGDTNWSMVGCCRYHTASIKTDGTLWTWGSNYYGVLGDDSTVSRSSPGTTAGGGTNWSMVSNSFYQSAAIKTDGTLWTWGSNSYGKLGNNSITNRSSPGTTSGGGTTWSMVSCGDRHTAALNAS